MYKASIYFIHLLGTILMIGLSIMGFLVIWHIFSGKYFGTSNYEWAHALVTAMVNDQAVWASTAVIFATTVSIRHLWNYEVNLEKYLEEKQEKYREKMEERQKEEAKKIGLSSFLDSAAKNDTKDK